MESSTITTGGIFILCCIIIFVLINLNKRKKEKQLLQPLNRLALNDNCKITKYNIWNNSIIGLDRIANQLFVITDLADKETFQKIKLADVLKCRVNELSRTVIMEGRNERTPGMGVKIINKVELIFTNRDKNKPDIMVEFYNNETGNLAISGELQMAQMWCKLINDAISPLAAIR